MDFTLSKYKSLLQSFIGAGYAILTYEQYCKRSSLPDKFVILRHDIDRLPSQALRVAELEHKLSVHSTYYFRIVKQSNNPDIIRSIADKGMEIGYHYEDLSLCHGDWQKAEKHFAESLDYFRGFYPVCTVCMHGVPASHIDNKTLWQHTDYHRFGIIGEPYLNTDFNDVFYLTDTGRCWDGYKVSVRDKVPQQQAMWVKNSWVYHTTDDLVNALRNGTFPAHVLLTTHPQRWHNRVGYWLYEWLCQHIVNAVKYVLVNFLRKQSASY